MPVQVGLADAQRQGVVTILTALLADEYVLYTKTRNDHWNVVDHETIIRQLRVDLATAADTYHDAGTNDFLTGLLEQHEKMAWMLRACLPGASRVG